MSAGEAEHRCRFLAALRYEFADPNLLRLALTHPSFEEGTRGDYQRLEFLGDAILGAVVAAELYDRHPDWDEGRLTKMKTSLVSRTALAAAGREIGMAEAILLGRSEQGATARGMTSALADSFEAVAGAHYLDGGLKAAARFVLDALGSRIQSADDSEPPEHPKSVLQELLQSRGKAPIYRSVKESGPPHQRRFTVEVSDGEDILGSGTGASKKEAEMKAAEAALAKRKRRR